MQLFRNMQQPEEPAASDLHELSFKHFGFPITVMCRREREYRLSGSSTSSNFDG